MHPIILHRSPYSSFQNSTCWLILETWLWISKFNGKALLHCCPSLSEVARGRWLPSPDSVPDHGGVIPRLSVPDFVSQALENNQSCETKPGTGSLGSGLSVNYVRAYVIYCAWDQSYNACESEIVSKCVCLTQNAWELAALGIPHNNQNCTSYSLIPRNHVSLSFANDNPASNKSLQVGQPHSHTCAKLLSLTASSKSC